MRYKLYILIGLVLISLASCEDFFEKNISRSRVYLLSPPDGLVSIIVSQTFWWQELDGAVEYNLQIVSPSFSHIERLCLDTNIAFNKFTFSVLPGTYEWRVKAFNFSSETPWSIHTLTIDSTTDISHQTIMLLTPADKDTTNTLTFFFSWEQLYNADNYNYQVDYNTSQIVSMDMEGDSITLFFTEGDGSYSWKVRGQNSISNTQYSFRSFYIDTEPPPVPQLVTPAPNAVLPDSTVYFSWNRPVQTGSSVRDSLLIANDSLFQQLVDAQFLTVPEFTDSLGLGIYYWKVRSIDKAGNKSNYSAFRKCTIQ